jgi:hypothetical protein
MAGRLNAIFRGLVNALSTLAKMEVVTSLALLCVAVALTLHLTLLVRLGAVYVVLAAYVAYYDSPWTSNRNPGPLSNSITPPPIPFGTDPLDRLPTETVSFVRRASSGVWERTRA